MSVAEPSRTTRRSGETGNDTIYVITCGVCGQSWQRSAAQDGQAISCIFCGCQGHLCLGAAPPDGGAGGHCRVEVWLHAGGGVAQ